MCCDITICVVCSCSLYTVSHSVLTFFTGIFNEGNANSEQPAGLLLLRKRDYREYTVQINSLRIQYINSIIKHSFRNVYGNYNDSMLEALTKQGHLKKE